MTITSTQSRAARKLLSWSLEDLAHASGVSIFTVRSFERGQAAEADARVAMQRAFEGAGVEFGKPGQDDADVRLATKRR
jgi:transcriptional regulator with XRE-family HTH domain